MQPGNQIGIFGWVRVSTRLIALIVWLIACVCLFYLYRAFGRDTSNPAPRRFMAGVARISGVQITTSGPLPTGPTFLLANHVSWIDIPALVTTCGASFIAHDGLASFSALRIICEMNNTVFIARHDRQSVNAQVAQVRQAMAASKVLALFPEGTTGDGTELLPFKSSLLSALEPIPEGISIQPVLLDYGKDSPDIAWVGEEAGSANFLKIMGRKAPVALHVRFLPPLTGAELTNRKTISAAAYDRLNSALRSAR